MKSPIFLLTATATVAVDKQIRVDTKLGDGKGLSKVTMTPSQLPDGGKTHKYKLNEDGPEIAFTNADPITVTVLGTHRDEILINKILFTSGKNLTTFKVEGNA